MIISEVQIWNKDDGRDAAGEAGRPPGDERAGVGVGVGVGWRKTMRMNE